MRKPDRKVQRYIRRYMRSRKGKRKGNGKRMHGKGVSSFAMGLSKYDYEDIFFGGRGKGKGRGKQKGVRSTGKSAGRKMNPRGRDGRIMKCYTPGCHSQYHLAKDCPMGKGRGRNAPTRPAQPSNNPTVVYVDEYESLWMTVDETEALPLTTLEQLQVPTQGTTGASTSIPCTKVGKPIAQVKRRKAVFNVVSNGGVFTAETMATNIAPHTNTTTNQLPTITTNYSHMVGRRICPKGAKHGKNFLAVYGFEHSYESLDSSPSDCDGSMNTM